MLFYILATIQATSDVVPADKACGRTAVYVQNLFLTIWQYNSAIRTYAEYKIFVCEMLLHDV